MYKFCIGGLHESGKKVGGEFQALRPSQIETNPRCVERTHEQQSHPWREAMSDPSTRLFLDPGRFAKRAARAKIVRRRAVAYACSVVLAASVATLMTELPIWTACLAAPVAVAILFCLRSHFNHTI